MSAELTGTQAHDNSTQPNGNHPQGHASESATQQHLTPDRPPQAPDASAETGEGKQKRPRGFAAMDRKVVSEIARKGGKAAHSAGTAHEFTSEEARVAGRKGGRATHAKRRQGDESTAEPQSEESSSGHSR